MAAQRLNRLADTLTRATRDLRLLERRAALVGGLAVSAQTEPRFTRDADLAVDVADDSDAERLLHALRAQGYAIAATVEHKAAHRLATARLTVPSERRAARADVVVDLLFASSGVEPEIVAAAEPLEIFPGVELPVARVGHLIATKLLSRDDERRPQDAADLRQLLAVANPREVQRARTAAKLIGRRGFDRGRDLSALLEAALASRATAPRRR